MGSADPNAHFRSCQAHTHIRRTVDKDLSGPIELPRPLHPDPHYSRLTVHHRLRRGPRSLDPCLQQRRAFTRRRRRFLRRSGFSRPILRIIAHHQITPCGLSLRPTLRGLRSHLFISPSRGFRIAGFQLRWRGWWMAPSLDLAKTHRVSGVEQCVWRDEPYHESVVGPPERPQLHKDQIVVRPQNRYRVDNGFGVGVLQHPRISQHC